MRRRKIGELRAATVANGLAVLRRDRLAGLERAQADDACERLALGSRLLGGIDDELPVTPVLGAVAAVSSRRTPLSSTAAQHTMTRLSLRLMRRAKVARGMVNSPAARPRAETSRHE